VVSAFLYKKLGLLQPVLQDHQPAFSYNILIARLQLMQVIILPGLYKRNLNFQNITEFHSTCIKVVQSIQIQNMTFPLQIFMKIINPPQHDMQISHNEYHPEVNNKCQKQGQKSIYITPLCMAFFNLFS
jgi:hypothetical protein